MTYKIHRASLLCHFECCASFCSHLCIQAGVTVQKHSILVKIGEFCTHVTLKFDRWHLKTNRTPLICHFKHCGPFCSHLWIQTGVTFQKCPNWGKICFNLSDFNLWPLTLNFCMATISVNVNYPWKFHNHTILGTLSKRCDRQTDKQTDRQTEHFIKLLGHS